MPIDEEAAIPNGTPLAQATVDAEHAGEGIRHATSARPATSGPDVSCDGADAVDRGLRARRPDPDGATPARLALPVDEDLSAALRALEETLLALVDLVIDAGPAAETAGRLAVSVDRDRGEAVQPAVGSTEVIPLACPIVSRADVDQLVAVSSSVLAPDVADDVADTLADKAAAAHAQTAAAARDDVAGFRMEMTCVLALIQVDHSADFDALARLWRPPSPSLRGGEKPDQGKVVLTAFEASAYGRLVDRCLAAWQPGDPLTRFVYRGR